MRNQKPTVFRPAHQPDPVEAGKARLAAWRAKQAGADAERPGSAARGYDAAWRALRADVLAREPNCRRCANLGILRKAKMVDHIHTVAARPDLRLERSNLQPLCWPCHNGKTIRFDGGLGRKRQP